MAAAPCHPQKLNSCNRAILEAGGQGNAAGSQRVRKDARRAWKEGEELEREIVGGRRQDLEKGKSAGGHQEEP